jgi:predicted GIY-YIG superfamily endonuclease
LIGIYKITNTVNGKVYIGQSWNIQQRIYDHRSKPRVHNEHLEYAIKKYGLHSFTFEILKSMLDTITQEELDIEEIEAIKQYKSLDRAYGYNIRAGGSRGSNSTQTKQKMSIAQTGKKHSVDTIKKLSISQTRRYENPEEIKKLSLAHIGQKVSEETRKKYSAVQIGHIVSDATREKIRNALQGRVMSQGQRLKISQAKKGVAQSAELKEKRSMAMKAYYSSSIAREKTAIATKRGKLAKKVEAKLDHT